MSLAQLLVVQAHDSSVRQLEHRKANLPELQALVMLDDEQTHLTRSRSEAEAQLAEIRTKQKRIEDDIGLIDDRLGIENERLYSGAVTAHKDLQLIQEELRILGNRKATLEDAVLDCMELAEPVTATIATIDGQLADVDTRRTQAQASLKESQGQIDAEIEREVAARSVAAVDISAELIDAYEQARAECGGVGACRLNGKTCEGCHLGLSAVEYDNIRKEPSDALIFHECGRILVRT